MNRPLFKSSYITEQAPAKAVVAAGGVTFQVIVDQVCATNAYTALSCSVAHGINVLLKILLGMMALDLITGIMASWKSGERIASRRLGLGQKRKVVMLAVVASAVLLDSVFIAHGLDTGGLLYKWTTSWFIAVEALSLYENADKMGVRMPSFLKTTVENLLQKAESSGVESLESQEKQNDGQHPSPN